MRKIPTTGAPKRGTIDFEGDIHVGEDGVELIAGRIGMPLPFPFRLVDLVRSADELELERKLF